MSTVGQIIGGIVGAVVGFYAGGPYGAVVGASLGLGIGSYIDPIKPDIPQPGQPQLTELSVNSAAEGLPIYDLLGTSKISTGNIIWYGNGRSVAIEETQETQGGKGGGGGTSTTYVTGYEYYLSWALAIVEGPIDAIHTIYMNDTPVYNQTLLASDYPAGYADITLGNGMGACRVYFGTENQPVNATMAAALGASVTPPYRGTAYAFFNDNLIGNYNRAPSMRFIVTKTPQTALTVSGTATIDDLRYVGVYDYNPAYAIYYILTKHLEFSADWIDIDSFRTAAQTLYNEGHGTSLLFDSSTAAVNYIETALSHFQAILRYGNGKLHLRLLRKDVENYNIEAFDEEDFTDKPILDRSSWLETLNEIRVQYALMNFRSECVKAAPILTIVSGSLNGTCDGSATYGIDEGCPPYTLQTKTYGDYGDVKTVNTPFKWLYRPNSCYTTTMRIRDMRGEYSNELVLDKQCDDAYTGEIVLSATEVQCGQSLTVTLTGTVTTCCDITMEASGPTGGSLAQTGAESWIYYAPDTTQNCDTTVTFYLKSCGVTIDTAVANITHWEVVFRAFTNDCYLEGTNQWITWATTQTFVSASAQDLDVGIVGSMNPSYVEVPWDKTFDLGFNIYQLAQGVYWNDGSPVYGTATAYVEKCPCVPDETMAWDGATSIDLIDPSTNGTVAVTGNNSPFTWSVAGTGFTLQHAKTQGLTNTLIASSGACGPATVTVVGCDGESVEEEIRCSIGSWTNPVWIKDYCAHDACSIFPDYCCLADGTPAGPAEYYLGTCDVYTGSTWDYYRWRTADCSGVLCFCSNPDSLSSIPCFDGQTPNNSCAEYRHIRWTWACI